MGRGKDRVLKVLQVRIRACQLQDWPGGTTDYQHLAPVTLNVSLSCDHVFCAKPTRGHLRTTLDWGNHPSLWSPSRDWDVAPIKIFLVIIQLTVHVMQNIEPFFHSIMYQNIQLESLFPSSCHCCYKVKQPQLSRKYHRNEHIIGQRRIN